MIQQSFNDKSGAIIEQGKITHIPVIAALFTECFKESVLHHCGGNLPSPRAMEDVFALVYQAEPEATLLARDGSSGEYIGYCLAPTRLSGLWLRALWEGHLLKWTWRWLTGQYGFGFHPIKIIVMNKLAFLQSSIEPTQTANARILSIAVLPKARGRGIASQLIGAAVDYFTLQGVTRVRLEVRPDNLAALRVYEKWGFIVDGYTMDSQGKWLIMFKEMEHSHV
ncbi:GNAT family N-acetyltransferase [Pelosinus sp. sgz500959]|uniref:GNAT family N-acetyltransferase n=1 Tax=Pelosinus sp. sgz500959 TaxID=3242472 RepID=UPI003671DC00